VSASAVPTLMRALRDGISDLLADAEVTLGIELDATPGPRVWVGYDDPFGQSPTPARSQQTLATMGARNRDEVGEVPCAVFVERADLDMDAALADAEGMVDAVGTWLVSARFQDLPQFTSVIFGESTQWLLDRGESADGGAYCSVLVQFSVGFKARLYP